MSDRASSFGQVAERYDDFRPPLPREVASLAGVERGSVVADLAAGTGLATRTYLALGARCIAIEPDPRMRAVLAARSDGAEVSDGTAERTGLPDASCDVVSIVSAWHWLEPAAAFAEATRVLRDGGRLLIAWNGADDAVDWVAAMHMTRAQVGGASDSGESRRIHEPERVLLPADVALRRPRVEHVAWTWTRSVEQIAQWFTTFSNVLMAPEDQRRAAARAIAEIAAEHADADGIVEVPMLARCFLAERAARASR